MTVTIASEQVPDPFERLVAYATRYSATLIRYDLAGQPWRPPSKNSNAS